MASKDRTLRNVSGGFRSLLVVGEPALDLDPDEVVTIKMTQAEYDDAIATGWFEDADAKPASRKQADEDADAKD